MMMKSAVLVSLALLGAILATQPVDGNIFEQRLQTDLMRGYNRLVRPVEKNHDQLVIQFGIKLIQILDVDEKNQILITNVWLKQTWKDKNLVWIPSEYGNLTSVRVPSSNIWIPDIILFNSADGKYEITLMTRAVVYYNGTVHWEPPAIFKSSCTINVEFFPFDVQHCAMKFGSWTYDGLQVDMIHDSQPAESERVTSFVPIGMDLSDFYQSHEWDIMSVPATRSEIRPHGLNAEFYPDITFNITLRRKTLFYTCNLIIPCVSISFLTILTFYLPSECGEKICLSISILLALTVFILLLNELIPPTSLVTPLIGKYLLFTVIMITLSLTVSVVVLNIHFRSPATHRMPPWAKRLFLDVLPRFLMMKPAASSSLALRLAASASAQSSPPPPASFRRKDVESPTYAAATGAVSPSKKLADELRQFLRATNSWSRDHRQQAQKQQQMCSSLSLSQVKSFLMADENDVKNAVKSNHDDELHYFLDKIRVLSYVSEIADNFGEEDEESRICQEWKYTASVFDRLFLLIFTTACVIGTISIVFQAPSFYDKQIPIDEVLSKNF